MRHSAPTTNLKWAICVALAASCLGLVGCGSSGRRSQSRASTAAATGTGAPARSENVSFDADGTTTFGTLEFPAHRRGERLAAALLLAGSGPTDRNGNDANTGVTASTLRLVASILAREGIMSLRFDKYFSGQTGPGRYATDPGAATLNVFLRQAADAYEFLRGQPDADPRRLLIVGHSEGGMYALVLVHFVSPKPVGVALLEPQDERLLSLIALQTDENINALVARGLLSRSAAIRCAKLVQRAIATYRVGRPVTTAGMAPLVIDLIKPLLLDPVNAAYNRTDDQIVPADWASKLPSGTQVLVTDGTRDPNVPPRTITPLVTALKAAGVVGPGYVQLLGTDHYMHPASQPDTRPVLADAAISAIQRWAHPFASAP